MFTVGNTLRLKYEMEPLPPGEPTPPRPKPVAAPARPAPSTPYSRDPARRPMPDPQMRDLRCERAVDHD